MDAERLKVRSMVGLLRWMAHMPSREERADVYIFIEHIKLDIENGLYDSKR